MKWRTLSTVSLLAALTWPPFEAIACTYIVPSYKVGKAFTVHVASPDGLTFAGVRVILVSGNQVARSARTDSEGAARFDEVEPDTYSLEIDQLGEFGYDTATVTVVDHADTKDLKLRWPSAHTLRATEVKGMLLDAGGATPLADTSVVLVNAVDGSLVARDLTQKTGEFDLGVPSPGLYFVKLVGLHSRNPEELGAIPVLVINGPKREITLAVQESSCGMQYSELCTARSETVSRLTGTISDSLGAAIDRARIELLRPADKRTLATIAPNKSGYFDFQYMPNDQYRLRISAVGFAPVLIPVNLDSDSKTNPALKLQLKVIGSPCDEKSDVSSGQDGSMK